MLDASVIAKLIMREENYRRAAEEIEVHGETMDLALIEVSNVILKYYRRGELSLQEARERFRELQELSKSLKVASSREFLEQAFEIALEKDLTIYDSLYIVGSDALITANAKQAREAEQMGRQVTLV